MSSHAGFVGRAVELAAATSALGALAEGRASALVIEGEAGIGKTRLVQAIEEQAHARRVTVFHGQAHPFERTRPFAMVSSALDLKRRPPDARRAAIASLLARDGWGGDHAAGDLHFRVLEEVVDLVEASCADRPVLLVAEDIHWADPASLSLVSAVVRRMPFSPVLVVVTVRSSPASPDVARLLDDLESAGARTLRLAPLPRVDVHTLAAHELGGPPGPTLSTMLDQAGGNPLWATALLRALADEGTLVRSGPRVEAPSSTLPTSLSDLVLRRLRDLSPATLELLKVAAVLGDAVWVHDLAAVARTTPDEVVGLLGEAFDARLLDEADDRLVFRHQLVQAAIYQRIPAPTRRVLHRQAGVALMRAGADRLDVADHLALGSERGDDEAVAWLRDAAREALPSAPTVSVGLLRRAEALLRPGHPDVDEVSAEVVEALLRAGQVEEASSRAEAVLARSHAPAVDVRLRLALLGALALQNRAPEVITVAQAVLAGPTPLHPLEEVPVLAQQSWALTYSGDAPAGESVARRALEIAEGAGVGALTVWALTALLVAVGRQGRFGEALAQARRAASLAATASGTPPPPLQPKLFLGLTLFDCDLVKEARAAYRDALDEEFGSGWWLADTLMADAAACFEVGDWEDAGPRLVAAEEAARRKHHPLLLSQSLAFQTIIATGAGDLAAASTLASGIEGSLTGEELSYNAGIIAFAVARLRSGLGDDRSAFDVLLRCWRHDATHASAYYHRKLAPDLVRLALALDHRAVAVEVTEGAVAAAALEPDIPSVRSVALRCTALVAGDVDAALEAVGLARKSPLLLEHVGACDDATRVLAGCGRTDEATALLMEALERLERAGAEAWAGRVRAQLRDLGAHPGPRGPRRRPATGWQSLSATERSVSALVAEGMTNGAIARRLYISPHTVNTHLRHVFAKLGVSNRVELAVMVHRSIE
ncbi:helix-turn-helix transcriptional regulator [Humibacillus xanthopallidus]|uniref:Regulatory LuxR family protein n=1 Tax=Humibacillus xanthopallidus TaxID=412689 RepID=A0A543I239_9MICO|nr:AAA family ATPase [Humibacillus xanthopallidus]TQM64632.1 regulatory LuxR family protein [Humibacillus xanthopallidus]